MTNNLESPLPVWFTLAVILPGALLLANEVTHELGGPSLHLALGEMIAIGLASTLSAIFIIFGLRSIASQEHRVDSKIKEAQAAIETTLAALSEHQRAMLEMEQRLTTLPTGSASSRSGPQRKGRWVAILAVVVVVIAAGTSVTLAATLAPKALPIHIHAAFGVFDTGQRLSYADPRFDLSARGQLNGHLHTSDPSVLHIEGMPGSSLATLLANAIDLRMQGDSIRLDNITHGGRLLTNHATTAWVVGVAPSNSTQWQLLASGAAYVPQDHDHILVSYGADPAEIEKEEALVLAIAASP